MYAVVGLGNPGVKYEETRHNVGFRVVIECARKLLGAEYFCWKEKFGCRFVKVSGAGEDEACLLVLPLRYMNLSGEAAVPLLKYFKIDEQRMVVVHDELDLDPGVLRIKRGGSAGGHKGVENLILHLGTRDFYRLRLGIGHPRRAFAEDAQVGECRLNSQEKQQVRVPLDVDVSEWVLGKPGPKEKELLDKTVPIAADAVRVLWRDGLEAAQRRFHHRRSTEVRSEESSD